MKNYKSPSLLATILPFHTRIIILIIFCVCTFYSGTGVFAQTIIVTSQQTLWVDANKCGATGPQGAWLSFGIINNGITRMTNVTATFSGFTGSGGMYHPEYFVAPHDLTRTFAAIEVNDTIPVYFYVDYSAVCGHSLGGGDPYTGYLGNYSVTVTSSSPTVTYNGTVSTADLLTANAAGIAESSPLSVTTTHIGQIFTQAVTYSFGNNTDVFFQPNAEAGFPDGCLRLIEDSCSAISGNVTGILGKTNFLWVPAANFPGGGGTCTIIFTWQVLCTNISVILHPWAAAKSGVPYKYTGFAATVTVPAATQAISILKSVSPTLLASPTSNGGFGAGIVQWTVTLSNSATSEILVSNITDLLPGSATCNTISNPFATGSGVTQVKSNSWPVTGSSGSVSWVGITPERIPSWQYKVPPKIGLVDGTLTLVYQTNVSGCPTTTSYTNSATAAVGSTTLGPVTATVQISGPDLSITKTDSKTYYETGNSVYTVVVTNSGPGSTTGATVTDAQPAGTTLTWSVTGTTGGASVSNSSGSGSINELVNMPMNSTITYQVTVDVPCGFSGTLTNTASIATPAGITDPSPGNNSATDSDLPNTWIGTTSDWNAASNWTVGVPRCTPSSLSAIIPIVSEPYVYPVINSDGNFAANLIILAGAKLTINPSKDLTVCGCTQVNTPDGLIIRSNPTGNASFINQGTTTYPNNGTANVELYITQKDTTIGGELCQGCWHYASSPIVNALSGVFDDYLMKSWTENGPVATPYNGWSDYIFSTTYPLEVGKGYAFRRRVTSPHTVTFDGQLNSNSEYTKSLTRTVGAGYGNNLVGNPYPTYIDFENGVNRTNVDPKMWYYDMLKGNYSIYIINGSSTGTRYVPSMQGFFVHVTAPETAGTLVFSSASRTTTGTVSFYKNSISLPDELNLKIHKTGQGYYDDAVVAFRQDANEGYDVNMDAAKMFGAEDAPQLFTINSFNDYLSINTLPYNGVNTTVPLNFMVSANGDGQYTLTASQISTFRAGTGISLEDKATNQTHDLATNQSYSFTYHSGDAADRFLLHFYNPFFGLEDENTESEAQIYSFNGDIYVYQNLEVPVKGEISIFNLIGVQVFQSPISDQKINKYSVPLSKGYYLTRGILHDKVVNRKVYID